MPRSAVRVCLCAALAVVAGACGQIPQPYLRTGPSTNPLAAPAARGGVVVEPVAGAPNGAALGQAVADALQRRGVAVHWGPAAEGRARLSGDVSPEPADPGYVLLRFGWRVPSEGGTLTHTHSIVASAEAWRSMSLALTHRIAESAAQGLAPLIEGSPTGPGSAPTIAVVAVAGAPGDGGLALRRAMAFELGKEGYPTLQTLPEAPGALTLRGKVTVGRAQGGAQEVAIAWTMRDAKGKVVGTARQASRVPAGSLDGSWGVTAISVARAALPAIVKMARAATDAGPSAQR